MQYKLYNSIGSIYTEYVEPTNNAITINYLKVLAMGSVVISVLLSRYVFSLITYLSSVKLL